MKTLELDLKKKVLIIDAISQDIANGIIFQEFGVKTLSEFEFLCKGSELTEEIASELVEQSYSNLEESIMYRDYRAKYDDEVLYEALKSFKSAIESKGFYWLENPIKHPKDYEVFPDSLSLFAEQEKLHLEAEEKTFKSPLIFVKK